MNKNNNKLFVVLSVFAVMVLFLVFYLVVGMKSKPVDNGKKVDVDPVAQMKDSNQDMVDKARNSIFTELRKIDDTDYAIGGETPLVEIIFYGDYDDEFSSEFNKTLKKARDEFGEKIKIAFRHFPQRQHMNSFKMAFAAECAGEQEKFWEMHEKLFFMKDKESFSHDDLMIEAVNLGLNPEEFDKCLLEERYKEKILKQIDEAEGLSVIGTPTTYVNGVSLTGATPWEDFVDSAGFERVGLKGVIEGEME